MKKIILSLLLFIFLSVNVYADTISTSYMSSKGEEPYDFKIVNSSGETVEGVKFTVYRESLVGGCSNSIKYHGVSTSDWTTINMEKDMDVWYVKSDSVPDGYKDIECSAVTFSSSNKKTELLIYNDSEDSKAKEIVGVGYNDYIHDDGYVPGIKYALYLNGNCSGSPYLTGVSNDYIPTYHSIPVDTLVSIKPYEYPQEYLSKLEFKYDRFFCNSFKIRQRLSKPIEGSSVGAIKFDSPSVLLFGAALFGADIGHHGELIYVEEGEDSSDNKTTDNKSSNNTKDNSKTFEANFYIDDKLITSKMDVFLENDRTYINIEDLCYYMDCDYEKKDDTVVLKYNFNSDGLKNMSGMKSYLSKVQDKIKYVVTHKIGSKNYSTFLEIKNFKSFALKSPTFKSESVDVTSKIVDGKVYLPLRFLSEALGRYVEYEPSKDGELPNIIVSPMGVGDFYEKYSVYLSFDEYTKGSMIKINDISNNILLNNKTLYAYGLLKDVNKINNVNETIFIPLSIDNGSEAKYDDDNTSIYKNDFVYKNFVLKNNSVKRNDNNSVENELFAVISNIEGYPFIEIVELS